MYTSGSWGSRYTLGQNDLLWTWDRTFFYVLFALFDVSLYPVSSFILPKFQLPITLRMVLVVLVWKTDCTDRLRMVLVVWVWYTECTDRLRMVLVVWVWNADCTDRLRMVLVVWVWNTDSTDTCYTRTFFYSHVVFSRTGNAEKVCELMLWCLAPLSTIFQLSIIGGRNQSTRTKKPPTFGKSLTNIIT